MDFLSWVRYTQTEETEGIVAQSKQSDNTAECPFQGCGLKRVWKDEYAGNLVVVLSGWARGRIQTEVPAGPAGT